MEHKDEFLKDSQNEDRYKSQGPLRTDLSNSAAQSTTSRPQNSHAEGGINGGPSVGVEDSKFLLESFLAQNSVSLRQESKFSAGPETSLKKDSQRSENQITPDLGGQQSLAVIHSEHFSSAEEHVMNQRTEQFRGSMAEDGESNGHSPMHNMHSNLGASKNPLNSSMLREF